MESIEERLSKLREIVPGVRVTVGHGQLNEEELSRRMHAFTRGDFDVLLATTIIENGIDIPNVNTMIVHRADRFGLAQLYQLRGRVGRSNQLAYCYFLVPEDRILSEQARKRLAALREFSDLGAGFRIAARDLEIRGAGNLLGGEQSGHIGSVGIETYLKLLEETVRELRGESVEEAPSVALDLPVPMSIPSEYVDDANLRMELYRKIAEEPEREMLAELADRFGPPPAAVQTLVEVAAPQASGRVAAGAVHLGQGRRAGHPPAARRAYRCRETHRDGIQPPRGQLQSHRRAVAARRRRAAAGGGGRGRPWSRWDHERAFRRRPRLRAGARRPAAGRLPALVGAAPGAGRRGAHRQPGRALRRLRGYLKRTINDADGVLGSDVLSQLFDQFLEERLLVRLAIDGKVVREAQGAVGQRAAIEALLASRQPRGRQRTPTSPATTPRTAGTSPGPSG